VSTVASLNSVATQLGVALGTALGGVALSLIGWGAVGVTYGAMHLVAAAIYSRTREEEEK
jgi:predicted MFS family arabinose efflux permease